MTGPADPTFESDVRRRIYEYVERNGAASPSEIRHEVRIDAGPPASKPARSGGHSAERTPMPVAQVREHLMALDVGGYLIQDNGKYRVAIADNRAAHPVDDGIVTIRPARNEDHAELASVIRDVASEDTYIVARAIAEAIDHEETLLRHNQRRSRVFFVATYQPNGDTNDEYEPDEEGKIVGWVHLEGLRLDELRHVAELTVGVVADHRQEGIGKRLLEHGSGWATEAGYEKVYQTLPATNEDAIVFLESEGWEREATHVNHYRIGDEYVDEVLLATWL